MSGSSSIKSINQKTLSAFKSRIIAEIGGEHSGELLCVVCGVHGNEISGVKAVERIIKEIKPIESSIKGKIIFIKGNIKALSQKKRFIDRDLNRVFFPQNVDIENETQLNVAEFEEMNELMKLFEQIQLQAFYPKTVIDLHTTSAPTGPFIAMDDRVINRKLAFKFKLPIILGIEEYVQGALFSYVNQIGFRSLVFEAGQHQDKMSALLHESFIWLCLYYTKIISKDILGDIYFHQSRINYAAKNTENIYDIRYHYKIRASEQFAMFPGFSNFQPIEKGQRLAKSNEGVISAPISGRIFMPLYQKQGDDGFFIVRKISKVWLILSAYLRKWNTELLLLSLPGVNRSTKIKEGIEVNLRIARIGVEPLFHLFGYRQKRRVKGKIVFVRREF